MKYYSTKELNDNTESVIKTKIIKTDNNNKYIKWRVMAIETNDENSNQGLIDDNSI